MRKGKRKAHPEPPRRAPPCGASNSGSKKNSNFKTREGGEDNKEHLEYLVGWQGYGLKHDSWKPKNSLHPGATKLLNSYQTANKLMVPPSKSGLASAKSTLKKTAKAANLNNSHGGGKTTLKKWTKEAVFDKSDEGDKSTSEESEASNSDEVAEDIDVDGKGKHGGNDGPNGGGHDDNNDEGKDQHDSDGGGDDDNKDDGEDDEGTEHQLNSKAKQKSNQKAPQALPEESDPDSDRDKA
ncbi:hypothetical protein PSTT_01347 [Puccinia striiformis]|uniref:Chromo domain-containing protein n=1 Tax=Puccinia striiformis TaxID=27350 RepID=A0A2S4W416_9BASI|nr:hypothetical protein PSTT_01347 [Puccinia striiformis]